MEWAGLRTDALNEVGAAREQGRRVVLRAAALWVHCNRGDTATNSRVVRHTPFPRHWVLRFTREALSFRGSPSWASARSPTMTSFST